jgi:hypothetical protein
MDSDRFKFSRFCDDLAEYDAAESYWDDFVADILSNETDAEGWKLLPRTRTTAGMPWTEDGQCTMLSLLHEARKRWVTIEQFAPSTGVRGVWAGVERFGDPDSGPVLERLRIDCVLTADTEIILRQLVTAFVIDHLPEQAMDTLISRLGAARM